MYASLVLKGCLCAPYLFLQNGAPLKSSLSQFISAQDCCACTPTGLALECGRKCIAARVLSSKNIVRFHAQLAFAKEAPQTLQHGQTPIIKQRLEAIIRKPPRCVRSTSVSMHTKMSDNQYIPTELFEPGAPETCLGRHTPPPTLEGRAAGQWATRTWPRKIGRAHGKTERLHATCTARTPYGTEHHRSNKQASGQRRRRQGGAGDTGGRVEGEQARSPPNDDKTHRCSMNCLGSWPVLANQVPPQALQRRVSHRTCGLPTLCLLQRALLRPAAAEGPHNLCERRYAKPKAA